MRRLIELCLLHRGLVAALALLALMFGSWRLQHAPFDVFPEFFPPQVSVQTEAPGLDPEAIETRITRPLEAALNSTPGLQSMRSESIPGLSVITLSFYDDVDPVVARQHAAENLSSASGLLPPVARPPSLSPLTSSTMDLLKIGLLSDRLDPFALRDLGERTIRPRLLAVSGVARITVFGGAQRQWQVQADPQKLAAFGVSLPEVIDAARSSLGLAASGALDTPNQRIPVVTQMDGGAEAVLGQAVLRSTGGSALLLRDVANVVEAPAVLIGDALIQGKPGVLLTISGQYGANTLATTRAVEAALEELRPALERAGVRLYPSLHRPASFIERALAGLAEALLIGGGLILIVLLVVLGDWRSALISFFTIPLALLAAVAVLAQFGQSLNAMTLGGFAVALGVLVDDAIIGIENVMRRLHLNAVTGAPRARLAVILDASLEIRAPVIYATWVILLVFLPIFALGSVQGRLLAPLAVAFSLAVLASLLVALTVTPALCALLLRDDPDHAEPRWLAAIGRGQNRALDALGRRLGPTTIVLGIALIAAVVGLTRLRGDFFPAFREGHFVLQVASRLPGTSLTEMRRIGKTLSEELLALPWVASVEQQIGRAEMGEDTWGTQRSEFHLELKPGAKIDQAEAQRQLRALVESMPAIQSEVMTFLGDRLSETLTGDASPVLISVVGPDLDSLERVARQMAAIARSEPGVIDVQDKSQAGLAELAVRLDPAALARYHVRAADALASIEAAFGGTNVGQWTESDRVVDVVVTLPADLRSRPENLGSLPLLGVDATRVPLSAVAEIANSQGRYSIEHEGGRRRASVGFGVSGRSAGEVVASLRTRLADELQLPVGTYLEFAGVAEAERTAHRELLSYSLLALLLIGCVLALSFRRPLHIALVLANLPFALIGSVATLAISGIGLSLGALVGLVTVFGISARNAILLLAHYEQLVDVEGEPWNAATARRGARERLRPVLMTAAVTALGLIPLAIGYGRPGYEIEAPMAITVLGGLLSSTLLTLLLIPELARRYSFRLR